MTDSASDWKKAIIAAMNGWRCEDDVVVSPQLLTPEAGYRDIDYESILLDPYRTVTAEYPFYVKSVSTALAKIGFTKHPYVADLGCGDGRFVRWLLNAGQEHVIGMDISRPNLHRLRERIRAIPGANDKVLLVEGDIAQPPLPKASVDLAMAVGVLFMLDKDYAKGVAAAGQLVREGGYLLTIDPTDYGAAMYAIVRHDLVELGKVLREKTKTVDIQASQASRYSVRSVQEMVNTHEHAGLRVVSVTGVPVFPSLIFGGVKQMRSFGREDLAEMKRLCEMLEVQFPDCWRAACILSQKSSGSATGRQD